MSLSHLRRLSKPVIRNCYGCLKFRSHSPKPRPLPKDRTEKRFSIWGYRHRLCGSKTKKKRELKAYILLFCRSVARAEHIELIFSLTTAEFIKSLKRLISRRDKPKIVYSDNAKTFKAGAKWLVNIGRDHKPHDFFIGEAIIWNFNVPKAPWWGGQFERLIGPIKTRLYKAIPKAQLTRALDIEIILSNGLLTYIEEEIDYPILTRNSLILGRGVNFPDAAPHDSERETMKKRHKYTKWCKEAL